MTTFSHRMILYAPSVTKILHSVHLILGSAQNFTFMASSLLDIVLFINSIKFSGFLAKREFLWLIRTCISVWDWRFDPQFSQSMQAIPTPSYIDLIMFSPTLPPLLVQNSWPEAVQRKIDIRPGQHLAHMSIRSLLFDTFLLPSKI